MDDITWIVLSRIKGLGIKKLILILNKYPDLKLDDISTVEFTQEIAKLIYDDYTLAKLNDRNYILNQIDSVKEQINFHNKFGIKLIPYNNINYPEQLKLIKDPPLILYCMGNLEVLKNTKNVAVVGTRKPTDMGIKVAEKVTTSFAERDFTIVSGLALGIDTIGHKAALKANKTTIAVMAGSLDKIYPRENKFLADQIINQNGLLISENPIGAATMRSAFVKRDRIQSGLSIGICPVQTSIDGGTMHTIRYAYEQKRLLFTPKILEPKDMYEYSGIIEAINKYGAHILETTNDYETLISLMEQNYNNIKRSNNKESKVAIPVIKSLDDVEQISLFESPSSTSATKVILKDKKLVDIVNQCSQLAKEYNVSKSAILKNIDQVWEQLKYEN
ncbi:hypothetical protein GC096_04025 [Paenibacillus sp. LMG 31461]|uniref:Smf/DprA SLOG domain-containing protein n=1 Tax=Paenibacillus plantarum TaxID=2654975 RepID=A0ABX1X565_9BACL|nr:DNA-processing protein DprA [Paenibacillus plantarum]NOU63214.1 hypothetical protein [Paenibacillus plantarum]